jgi:acyl-CoA dehydrogenase
MATPTDVAREYVCAVARRYVAGEDVTPEAAMAKNAAVAACEWVVHHAVQLHAGSATCVGVEVERHCRDARILGIRGGATEVLNELIAARLGLD